MAKRKKLLAMGLVALSAIVVFLLMQRIAYSHCDTMDGPVVKDAKAALEKGDVTPVLKWVKKDYESEIRESFKKAQIVRSKGPEAKEMADMYFFETLVRLHRAGEGAPYTGLKPAGEVEPIVAASDKALETGNVDALIKHVTTAVEKGIRERYAHAVEKKKHANESVDAGREYVEAYIEFMHYTERLYEDAGSEAGHHGEMKAASQHHD